MLHFNPYDHWRADLGMLVQNKNPGTPYESQVGDFGEYTGMMLMYWSIMKYNALAEQVVSGLNDMFNGTNQQLLPRGLYIGPNNPEPGKKRWVQMNGKWYRVLDMNQTQTWYLIAGLLLFQEKTGSAQATILLNRVLTKIVDDGWKITFDDEVTKQGSFLKHDFKEWYLNLFSWLPIGNLYIRAKTIAVAINEKIGSPRASFALWSVNFWGRRFGADETDRNNTSFALWLLAHIDEDFEDKFVSWEKKETDTYYWLKTRYESNREGNPDVIQDDLKFLLRQRMRAEYGL